MFGLEFTLIAYYIPHASSLGSLPHMHNLITMTRFHQHDYSHLQQGKCRCERRRSTLTNNRQGKGRWYSYRSWLYRVKVSVSCKILVKGTKRERAWTGEHLNGTKPITFAICILGPACVVAFLVYVKQQTLSNCVEKSKEETLLFTWEAMAYTSCPGTNHAERSLAGAAFPIIE